MRDWTRRSKLHHKATGCDDNQAPHGGFSGAEYPQHGAVQGPWNPRSRICAIKPQQGEEHFNDALERFAVAFDGPRPVHVISLSPHENNTGTYELNRNRLSRAFPAIIYLTHAK